MDGLGHVVDVLGGQPAHVDAAAGHQVDVFLFDHVFNLFSCETKTQRIDVRKKKNTGGNWKCLRGEGRFYRFSSFYILEFESGPNSGQQVFLKPINVFEIKTNFYLQGPSLSVLTVESGEAEHADLLGDVLPGPWSSQILKLRLQLISHQQHPVCHRLHVVFPAERTKKRQRQKLKNC